MVLEEVAILKTVSHENILNMIGAYQSSHEVIVVTEFLSGGELFEKVAGDDYQLTEVDCIQFMHQICDGVAYLHRKVKKSYPVPCHRRLDRFVRKPSRVITSHGEQSMK